MFPAEFVSSVSFPQRVLIVLLFVFIFLCIILKLLNGMADKFYPKTNGKSASEPIAIQFQWNIRKKEAKVKFIRQVRGNDSLYQLFFLEIMKAVSMLRVTTQFAISNDLYSVPIKLIVSEFDPNHSSSSAHLSQIFWSIKKLWVIYIVFYKFQRSESTIWHLVFYNNKNIPTPWRYSAFNYFKSQSCNIHRVSKFLIN